MFGWGEVVSSSGPGLGSADEGVVISPQPTNSLLFLCQQCDNPLEKRERERQGEGEKEASFDQTLTTGSTGVFCCKK